MLQLGLNFKIRAIAEAIYTLYGPGLPDKIYKESFIFELNDSGIKYQKDPFIPIDYKGHILSTGLYACFFIEEKTALYIKSSSTDMEYNVNQLYQFMRSSRTENGIILDFNSSSFVEVMRVFIERYDQ